MPLKEGFEGERRPKEKGEFTNNFRTYIYTPQNMYIGPCKCI